MKSLNIHCFQHVEFEDIGCISQWIRQKDHSISYTKFFKNEKIPTIENIDFLIVMGGAMSINDENEYKWLRNEKLAIKQAIDKGKPVLGICLGAQLIASILGAKIYKNNEREIGWFNISLSNTPDAENLLGCFKESSFKVFHWHGETFNLPENAVHLAYSEACKNQAFLYKNNVVGLQFHLEVTKDSLQEMIKNAGNEIVKSKFIQNTEEILTSEENINKNNKIMFNLLEKITK